MAGFSFESEEYIECTQNDEDVLHECRLALENFLEQIGAKVDTTKVSTFNPYEAGFSSTTGTNPYLAAS